MAEKEVVATKRLPLWQLSDEMYLERQLAPDPELSWTEVRRAQAKMKQQVYTQQKLDMKSIETELAGVRLPPTYKIGELRPGMWLEGRVSMAHDKGVMVDVGCYTERGEWHDGFLHCGQMRDDGGYVKEDEIMKEVYLGEHVRVRVVECVPATGFFRLSMRTEDDLPEKFLGQPRPYSIFDIEETMKVTGIVRRVWDKWALVDIGCDRLARLHVRDEPAEKTRYGFFRAWRNNRWAHTAFARGAQLELYVKQIQQDNHIVLTCNKPNRKRKPEPPGTTAMGPNVQAVPGNEERLTREQRRDREKSEAEKETWNPYVPHVDEWLEDAEEPDDETDSWVARTEKSIFEEMVAEANESGENFADDDMFAGGFPSMAKRDDELEEEFAEEDDFAEEDEFAEDDFADDTFDVEPSNTEAFQAQDNLEGWVLDDDGEDAAAQIDGERGGLTEAEVEDLFHSYRDVGADDFSR